MDRWADVSAPDFNKQPTGWDAREPRRLSRDREVVVNVTASACDARPVRYIDYILMTQCHREIIHASFRDNNPPQPTTTPEIRSGRMHPSAVCEYNILSAEPRSAQAHRQELAGTQTRRRINRKMER